MTQKAKQRSLLVASGVVIAVAVCLLIYAFRSPVGADVAGVPSFLVSTVTINAPQSGGTSYVTGSLNGSASYMQVWGRSVTRDNLLNGGVPQWNTLSYYPNSPGVPITFYGNVQAGYGDLLEVKATNLYYNQYYTDIKEIGYVPAGSDIAPPDFATQYINTSWTANTFTATLLAYYAVYDPSYPITVTLYENDNPANKSTLTLLSSSDPYPKTLSLTVGSGERLRLSARDNYGNERSLIYVTNQLNWAAASNLFNQEPNPAGAERTGWQGSAGHGVHLHNGSFVHPESLMRIRGRVLELDLGCVYRSRLSHDYTLGERWDSILHSRVAVDSGFGFTWFPGNGRSEYFQHGYDTQDYWISPLGLFVKLHQSGSTVTVSFPDGHKYIYQNNYLATIQDLNGNVVQFVRDSQNRVFRIVDDLGRTYRVGYFGHGRIAEIVDFTGDVVSLGYDSSGQLLQIVDQAGYERKFEYEVTGAQRMRKLYDRNDRVYCENTYDASGRVATQKVPAAATTSYVFNYTNIDSPPADGAHVIVTNPLGTVKKYYFDTASNRYLLTKVRTEANSALRASMPGYDWDSSAAHNWIETRCTFNLQNYLPNKSWIESCPGDNQTQCSGGSGVQKTPYTWFDYNFGVQTGSSVDPRLFGTLRLKRQDKNPNDESRTGPSIRESWTYETTSNYIRVSTYREPRSWAGMVSNYEVVTNPGSWIVPSTFMVASTYDPAGKGNLIRIDYPNVSQPLDQPAPERTGIMQQMTYNSYGQIDTSTTPSGVVTKFEYYSSGLQKGRLQKRYVDIPGTTQDPSETLEYDALGRAVARIDGRGYRWTRMYDVLGRIVSDGSPLVQLATTYVYDGEDLVEERYPNRDHNGGTPTGEPTYISREYEYYPTTSSSAGKLWKIIKMVKATGNPSAPETATTEYLYDASGNVNRVKTQFAKDAGGLPLYNTVDDFVDELNRRVRFVIYKSDPNANPPNITDDVVQDVYYDARGNTVHHVDTSGLDTINEYDGYGRLTVTNNPDGSSVRTDYHDPNTAFTPLLTKYVVHISEPSVKLSKTQEFIDEVGRPFLQRVYHDVSMPEDSSKYYEVETWFNKSGQETRKYDYYMQGMYASLSYDGAGRIASRKLPGVIGQEPLVESYSYDLDNNIAEVALSEWSEAAATYAPTYYVKNTYDSLGRLYIVREGGQATQDQHQTQLYLDSMGRERRRTFSTLGLETLTKYDLSGKVSQTREKINATTWNQQDVTYDYLGQVLTVSRENATGTVVYASKHDPWGNGRLEEFELPAVGGVVDKHRREFYPDGKLWKEIDPNGTVREYVYDVGTGLLTHLNITPGAGIFLGGARGPAAVEYEYTPAGGCSCSGGVAPSRITTRRDGVIDSIIDREYTPLGELKKEATTVYNNATNPPQVYSGVVSYAYDYNQYDGSPEYSETMFFGDVAVNPNARFVKRVFGEGNNLKEVRTNLFIPGAGAVVADYKYQGVNRVIERNYYNLSIGSISKITNRSTYDSFGWGNHLTNNWFKVTGGVEEQIVDWSATYDPANRIATKRIGRIEAGGLPEGEFQFKHDLLGRLTHTYYSLGAGGSSDWSDTSYEWDKAGVPTKQRQLFSTGTGARQDDGTAVTCVPSGTGACVQEDGQCGPESTGYCYTTNERGIVTGVSGWRNLAYWDSGLTHVARRMGPQTRTVDKNGNVTSIMLMWQRLNNPATSTSCNPPCPCNLENETRNYEWYFEYDAWNRLTFTEKSVSGDWAGCPADPCPHPYAYTHTLDFTYDGLGRRVLTRFVNSNVNNNQCVQDSASLPADFNSLPGELVLLNLYDKEGRIVQRGGEITYIHGMERMPVCGLPGSPGESQGGGGSILPAYFYLTDVQNNASAIADGDGGLHTQRWFTDCNTILVSVSANENPLGVADTYGFDYGDTEPAFMLVDDRNCSPCVLPDPGGIYITETKERLGAAGDANEPPPKPKCLIYAFCETEKRRPFKTEPKLRPDCEVMKQVILFLRAYCTAKGKGVNSPTEPTPYRRADIIKTYSPGAKPARDGSRHRAFETFMAWLKSEIKNEGKNTTKGRQGIWEWLFFVAEQPDLAENLNFGAEITTNQMQDLSKNLLNPNLLLLDSKKWKPDIDVYLPGCVSSKWNPSPDKMGLKRKNNGIEMSTNIFVNSSAGLVGYNGDMGLSSGANNKHSEDNDKANSARLQNNKYPSRYGPSDPQGWKRECNWKTDDGKTATPGEPEYHDPLSLGGEL